MGSPFDAPGHWDAVSGSNIGATRSVTIPDFLQLLDTSDVVKFISSVFGLLFRVLRRADSRDPSEDTDVEKGISHQPVLPMGRLLILSPEENNPEPKFRTAVIFQFLHFDNERSGKTSMGSFEMSMPKRFKRIYFPGNSRLTAPSPIRISIIGESSQMPIFPEGVGIPLPTFDAFPDKATRSRITSRPRYLRALRAAETAN